MTRSLLRTTLVVLVAALLVEMVGSCSRAKDDKTAVPNFYALARSGITSGVAMPTTRPPHLVWVSLTSADGDQIASLQHANAMVRVCRDTRRLPCGANVQPLAHFRFHGSTYRIVFAPLTEMPVGTRFALDEELMNYWRSVRFTDKIPAWLTMDLYPGGQFATQDAGLE